MVRNNEYIVIAFIWERYPIWGKIMNFNYIDFLIIISILQRLDGSVK